MLTSEMVGALVVFNDRVENFNPDLMFRPARVLRYLPRSGVPGFRDHGNVRLQILEPVAMGKRKERQRFTVPEAWVDVIQEIHVDDLVRSYTFFGRTDCYVQGTVVAIGDFGFKDCNRYKVLVEETVWCNRADPKVSGNPEHVYPPVNGTLMPGGRRTNQVKRVARETP